MTKEEAKAVLAECERNMNATTLALCFLMENGAAKVKEISEEEFSAAANEEVARVEAENKAAKKTADGHISFEIGCSKELHMKSFRLAKKFAEMVPADLVALLGNKFYSSYYHDLVD